MTTWRGGKTRDAQTPREASGPSSSTWTLSFTKTLRLPRGERARSRSAWRSAVRQARGGAEASRHEALRTWKRRTVFLRTQTAMQTGRSVTDAAKLSLNAMPACQSRRPPQRFLSFSVHELFWFGDARMIQSWVNMTAVSEVTNKWWMDRWMDGLCPQPRNIYSSQDPVHRSFIGCTINNSVWQNFL